MSTATIKQKFTVIIERENNGYVSLCPELDIASQGDTIEEAKINLKEAIELFLEYADPCEIKTRLKSEIFITNLEVSVG
jgi:predicted RNase H-like HicB family nuclease